MTARVLVVDDNPANRKLLEARLNAEYFEVLTATERPRRDRDLREGAVRHRAARRDDAGHGRLRGLPAAEEPHRRPRICRSSWSPRSTSPPTACAGSRPAPTISSPSRSTKSQLIARVRSLARLKVAIDELRNRANTTVALGMIAPFATPERRRRPARPHAARRRPQEFGRAPRRRRSAPHHAVTVETERAGGDVQGGRGQCRRHHHQPRAWRATTRCGCAARSARSSARATCRSSLIADPEDRQRVLRGLELGVNDWLARPVDRNELLARVRTQLRQKRYADCLREKVQQSIELALVRSADRPQQPPLPGKPSGDDDRERAHAPLAADADDPRHRPLQARQRHLRPRRRRRGAEGRSPTGCAASSAAATSCAGSAARNSSS